MSIPPRPALRTVLFTGLAWLSLAPGCSDGPSATPVPVDIAVSDAPVGELDAVVVTVDRVTLDRPGADVVVEMFPPDIPGDPPTDTITIDLLAHTGMDLKLLVDDLPLLPGVYQNVRLTILDQSTSFSYVDETAGGIKPIKVPSGELKLGGFVVGALVPQTFVLEFDLRKAMTYNPGPDRYILKPRGVRVVALEQASFLSGTAEPALFDSGGCASKPDPTAGNVVYLYRGTGLDISALADHFDPAIDPIAAGQWIEPYASARVAVDGSYAFTYLPAGDYTLAFACDAAGDDPDVDDGIPVPDPANQWLEAPLAPGQRRQCDFVAGPQPSRTCPVAT